MLMKNINKIISPFLRNYGYCYVPCDLQGVFRYEKEESGVGKYIIVDKVRLGNTIRLLFGTSIMKQRRDYQLYLINEEFENNYFWQYGDEDDLRDILMKFCNYIDKYVFEALDILSKEEANFNKAEHDKLSIKTKQKSDNYAEEFGLNFHNPKEQLSKFMEILIEQKIQTSEPNTDFIINSAAYYGELVIRNLGGYWERDDFTGEKCLISNVNRKNISISPLDDILNFWYKGEFYCHNLKAIYELIEKQTISI